MIIIGADYHPAFQQIAVVDSETGELNELRLEHREGAEKFYRDLAAQGMKVRVGMEASGHARWFERLLTELHFELWIGDAAEIRSKRVRKQKTDRQDAQLLLRLLLEDRFPRVWVPSGENRDLRQLLWHRHRMVQTRTRIMNQLQAVALNEGLRCKKRLSITAIMIAVRTPPEEEQEQLESFRLAPWASRRRRDLLELLDRLNPTIVELSQAIEQEVEKCPEAQRLRTHPGVGSLTALAFVLIIGRAERFQCGKQIASYLGLVPSEESSGDRRRLGHITKQGNSLLRFLLVEAAQVTVRSDPE
jgi:transposase